MSFFKEFKEDLSQAVNELANDEAQENKSEETEIKDEMVNTLDENTTESENDDYLSKVAEVNNKDEKAEDIKIEAEEPVQPVASKMAEEIKEVSNEIAEITKGMYVEGNIVAAGSINLNGKVKGDISSNGKLSINGEISGNSEAKEIFTNNAKIVGDVKSSGSVKIGNGTVIMGNVYGTSAVIAGAVKGEVDIKGPVIVDATAIVQGDIKSRSVQINNGAVIDGRCSQCYADVDFGKLFDETFL